LAFRSQEQSSKALVVWEFIGDEKLPRYIGDYKELLEGSLPHLPVPYIYGTKMNQAPSYQDTRYLDPWFQKKRELEDEGLLNNQDSMEIIQGGR